MQSAPSSIVISDRNGQPTMFLEGINRYFGTGSDTPNVIDPYSGQRRPALKQDVTDAARICDYLPNIDFVMTMGLASDVNTLTSDRHHFEAMRSNTTKPIIFTAWDLQGLKDIYDMCVAVAGSAEAFLQHPSAILYAESTTPLLHSRDAIQKLLFWAEKGLPVVYISGPMLGGSAPMTKAGAIVLGNAEFLSALVLSQLKRKGTPVIYGVGLSPLDMHTLVATYGGPEKYLGYALGRDIATYYGLPIWGTGGITDSKILDQQAAIESTFTLLTMGLSGNSLIHDVGFIESGLTSSRESIVMGNEIISLVKAFLKGVDINPDTLALDIIDTVGPGGHFLTEDHTLEYFRTEAWYPELINRQNYSAWVEGGGKSLGEILNDKVKWILDNHQPEELAPEAKGAMSEIILRREEGLA